MFVEQASLVQSILQSLKLQSIIAELDILRYIIS